MPPSPAPRARPRARARLIAALGALVLICLPLVGVGATGATDAAHAAVLEEDYPSWTDVQEAKKNEAQAKAAAEQLRSLIAQLLERVAAAQKVAEEKGSAYAEAEIAYDEQALITTELQTQADEAQAEADAAKLAVGRFVVGLSRSAGNDLTMRLLTEGSGTDSLLYSLSASQRFTETNQQLYEQALQLQNSAQALTDQAEVARAELDELREIAEAAYQEAVDAAEAAQAAYDEQLLRQEELEDQLAYLTDVRRETQERYEEGVAERGAGNVSDSGWANPTSGCITSQFGQRYHPIYKVWRLHSGTDIGCAGFNAPIYAATGGTVIYAGWYGDFGNFIKIQHSNGVVTAYAHINTGGILVRTGQRVEAGQQIAKVGSTGGSTGPHLHFMVYKSGILTNPMPFMRDRGVRLGG